MAHFSPTITPFVILIFIALVPAFVMAVKSLNEDAALRNDPFRTIKVRDKILPIRILFIASVIYYPINFVIGMVTLGAGGPDIDRWSILSYKSWRDYP